MSKVSVTETEKLLQLIFSVHQNAQQGLWFGQMPNHHPRSLRRQG